MALPLMPKANLGNLWRDFFHTFPFGVDVPLELMKYDLLFSGISRPRELYLFIIAAIWPSVPDI